MADALTVTAPRVLLVDDRPSNLMALEALLAPLACETVLADSGEAALQLLLDEDFAVILLDVQLPGIDGFEVAELIKQRERTRHVPLIFLTAAPETASEARGYSVGAVDFVSKPFDPTYLRSKVAAFLELSQAHTQVREQAAQLEALVAQQEMGARRLAERAEELRRSNHELEDLAAIASHDLAEPLRVIAGYSELLQEHCERWEDEEALAINDAIRRGVARMQRLIDGMLLYARAGAVLPMESVAAEEVVNEVLLSLEAAIEERDAGVKVGPLPTVTYNRTQLTQVLQNLLSNAVKFVPPDRIPAIEVTSQRIPGGWSICVSDNGPGVSDEQRAVIFDMFARRPADEDTAGAGIGLAVCARIVARRGGALEVSPAPEGGSVFTVTIPDGLPDPSPLPSAT